MFVSFIIPNLISIYLLVCLLFLDISLENLISKLLSKTLKEKINNKITISPIHHILESYVCFSSQWLCIVGIIQLILFGFF